MSADRRHLRRALIECTRADDAAPADMTLPPDTPTFVRLLLAHRIPGRAWRRLKGIDWTDIESRDELRSHAALTVHRHLLGRHMLHDVARVLDSASLSWATFKGPVLAEWAYPVPTDRTYGDLDVLVSPQQFPEALEHLEIAGFRLLDTNVELVSRRMLGQLHLASADGGVVDLHWSLFNRPEVRDTFSFSATELLNRTTRVQVQGIGLPTLSAEDTLVHLTTHAALGGGDLLVWLMDVDACVRCLKPSPAVVADIARRSGAVGPVSVMLARTSAVLGTPVGEYINALGQHWLPRLVSVRQPNWSRPGRGGPVRWLVRGARADVGSSLAAAAQESRVAFRRHFRRGAPMSSSVFLPAGERRDLDQFLRKVAQG